MMIDHALELAACGWEVLPLRGKIPVTAHGCDDATTDVEQVVRWWTRWPDANIGARVPEPLLVIDVDPRNGGAEGLARLEADHGPLPETLTTVSGRGDGGRHLYFRRPPGKTTSTRMPKGIDVKASGYCVVPPSVHPDTGQPYVWKDADPVQLPGWLATMLRPLPEPVLRRSVSGTTDGRPLVDFVAGQGEGNRNNALFWAACRAVETGVLDVIEADLIAAALATGQPEITVKRTIRSARQVKA